MTSKFKRPIVKSSPKKAIEKLAKIAKEMSGPGTVKVGLPEGSNNYPDGTSVIMVGAVHEFGSPSRGVPERSFLRSTLVGNKRKYKSFLGKLAKGIISGKITSDKAMNLLGLTLSTDVKAKLTEIKDPPLKSREGNPLIDTGHLRQSITYKVDE